MGFMDQFKDAMSGGGMPAGETMEYAQRLQRLNADGVDTPATIRSLEPTGRRDPGGAEYSISVEVQPVGGTPYETTFNQFMHEDSMGGWATPGAAVKVKVDPADPNSMILWSQG